MGRQKRSLFLDAFETSKMITAAKKVYDKSPIWKRGDVIGGRTQPSPTSIEIQCEVNRVVKADEEYAKEVCDYTLSQNYNNEFLYKMQDLAKSYYCNKTQAALAFFMVKNYEDSKKAPKIIAGDFVKVEGKLVNQVLRDGAFGPTWVNTIMTDNNNECERYGTIPGHPSEGDRVSFYSRVAYVRGTKFYLDRALKNPKKGIEYMEI